MAKKGAYDPFGLYQRGYRGGNFSTIMDIDKRVGFDYGLATQSAFEAGATTRRAYEGSRVKAHEAREVAERVKRKAIQVRAMMDKNYKKKVERAAVKAAWAKVNYGRGKPRIIKQR